MGMKTRCRAGLVPVAVPKVLVWNSEICYSETGRKLDISKEKVVIREAD